MNVNVAEDDFTESSSLKFCLEEMARGIVAEGASVKIELVGHGGILPGHSVAGINTTGIKRCA